MQLNEQEIIRRKKLSDLRNMGIDPYPAVEYKTTHTAKFIKDAFVLGDPVEQYNVTIAGRLISITDMGKVNFAYLQDSTDRIQLYIKRDDICPTDDKTLFNTVWKKLLDIGDIVGVKGFVFRTKTGELSIHVNEFVLLSKSLKPIPIQKEKDGEVYDEVNDIEFMYRNRFVDLIINTEKKIIFTKITTMKNAIRGFLNGLGSIEVDTPILQSIPGGASARPFETHHNALNIPLYLRIANELYLKRLIVGGFDRVYEFSRNFRNEGMDRTHNPEFTVMEFYAAYKDYIWMMNKTEQLLEYTALSTNGTTKTNVDGVEIDFKGPYPRVSIYDAIKKYLDIDISKMDENELRENFQSELNIPKDASRGKIIDMIFGEYCEKHFIQPTFIIDYPIEMSPLTKKHREKNGLVERFELFINGKEIANAYSELNDPIDQRRRFEEQMELLDRGDNEAMYLDENFLTALEYGMPPTSGIGIGIDRLAMLLTGNSSIQDVLLFPQLRPKH